MAKSYQGEDDVLARTKKVLKEHGAYVIRASANAIGTPDIIACLNGRFLGIEVKLDRNGSYRVTKAQAIRMRNIENAGGIAIAVDKYNVDSFLDELETQWKTY